MAGMKRPAAAVRNGSAKRQKRAPRPGKLPVSTLCGFLGAGKTTLLKHILESKQTDADGFRCAVIVNDMAELNIDKSLIDQSSLVQSEDVIALQNGCVCCTLQNDLVSQINSIAKKKTFDYMLIEASGVSEPAQIAKLFAECEEDHDHGKEHAKTDALSQLARLDTCVTVVDSADFFTKFKMIKQGPKHESFPQLLVEQIEYANVIILNKTDLVSKVQLEKVKDQVSVLNPRATILTSRSSKIDVAEVVNSGQYKAEDFTSFLNDDTVPESEELKDCCKESMVKGGLPCCRRKRTRDSGKSKVVLGYTGTKLDASGKALNLRHSSRFGITSFIYQSRRPFHPDRFDQEFVDKFFVLQDTKGADEEEQHDMKKKKKGQGAGKRMSKAEKKKEVERDAAVRKQQRAASKMCKIRTEKMGELLRSKGFIWLANRHDFMGVISHASDVLAIDFPERWMALQSKAWEGDEDVKAALRKDWVETWGDRRQDLVFIGKDLKHEAIQDLLDSCLLTDDEMMMGPDGWKATFGDILLDHANDSSDEE